MTIKTRFLGFIILLAGWTCLFSQTPESTTIYEKDKESILALYAYGNDKQLVAKGVGFGVGQDTIATCYHLVSQAREVEGINVKGKKMKVEGIVSFDRNLDVAILKIKGKIGQVTLGNSDELQPGARIFALGANEAGDIVVSEGTLRNLHRLDAKQSLIEPSLSVPEGFTGGPLLNVEGKAVGIVRILEKTGRVAIPVNSWKSLPQTGKVTAFKDFTPEDYLGGFEGAYLAGRALALIDDLGNAQRYLEKAVKLNPQTVEAHATLATIYANQRNYSSAVSAFNKVVELDPNRAEAHFGLGNIYFRMQRWNEAIASLEKAVSLKPDYKEAHFTIGNACEELRDFEKAARAYERYLETKPESTWAGYLRLGLSRIELGQFDLAVAALEAALKEQPQDIKVNYSLAEAYQKAGQLEKAEATYANLAALNPADAVTYYSAVVRMYDDAGRFENAIEAAKKIIEVNPTSEIAVYNLGIMYYKLERNEEAIQTFRQALSVKPDYDAAYYMIGICSSKQKKYRESIEAFKNYVALVPDNADAWFNIGVGYMQLKDFDEALEPLRKSVELRPDYGVALFNLAITYINLKDNYSARDVYKTLVTVDPDLAERLRKYLR
ncbi:MAG: tetratricopeptide repeat protein [Candidatus Aminicenantes bacterium]|nr:tetratricopeptide repeat protein [Candidatus Aminicenantes bacterium]